MPEIPLEALSDLAAFALELAAMVALSAVGVLAERAGVASLASGFEPVAVWLMVVGAIALYAGLYMIGYRRVLGRVAATRSA